MAAVRIAGCYAGGAADGLLPLARVRPGRRPDELWNERQIRYRLAGVYTGHIATLLAAPTR